MGYYTEFHFKMNLRKDTPAEIIRFIHWQVVLKRDDPQGNIPDHKFFKLDRWETLFSTSGLGHEPPAFFETPNNYHTLVLNGEVNYGYEEVEEFVNWISPHIAGRKKKQFIGWSKGENWECSRINHYAIR